jgi:hypothetical protein
MVLDGFIHQCSRIVIFDPDVEVTPWCRKRDTEAIQDLRHCEWRAEGRHYHGRIERAAVLERHLVRQQGEVRLFIREPERRRTEPHERTIREIASSAKNLAPSPAWSVIVVACSKNMSIVWLGDSWGATAIGYLSSALTNRCGFPVTVIDAHVSGQTLQQMNARFATDVLPFNPRYVIVQYGANDINGNVSLAQMQADIRTAIANCRSNGMKPIVLGLPPINSQLSTALSGNDSIRAEIDKVYQ